MIVTLIIHANVRLKKDFLEPLQHLGNLYMLFHYGGASFRIKSFLYDWN